MTDEIEPFSETALRLGLKVVGGARGAAIAEAVDIRRTARRSRRVEVLKEGLDATGADGQVIADRIEADDAAQELFEEAVRTSASSRYDAKIRYLGRCLANALSSDDDAAIDLAHLRMEAVERVEAAHGLLLALVSHIQAQGWQEGALESQLVMDERVDQPGLLRKRSYRWRQFDRASFEPLMATLVRAGLVDVRPDYDLQVEIELSGDSVEDASVETQPSLDAEDRYALTALGREVLEALTDGEAPELAAPTDDP